MPGLIGDLVAGGMSGGAQAESQVLAAQRQADLEKQLIQQRAETESHFQQAAEQRHIQYAANLRTAMDQQLTPATEAILNAQGKTSAPQSGGAPQFGKIPNQLTGAAPTTSSTDLTATGVTPGAPAATDYAQQASGLLAGPSNVPATPQATKPNLAPASPTDILTARALAMVQTGWVSNPDDVLKAAVTLNDTTQTSQARLEASKAIAEASIIASKVRGENAADIRVNNPAVKAKNNDVNLRAQAENLRKQLNDQYRIATDPLASAQMRQQAMAKKDALQKVLDGVMAQQQYGGQNSDSVVQSQNQNAVSWNDLPK